MSSIIIGIIWGVFFATYLFENKDEQGMFWGGIIVGSIITLVISTILNEPSLYIVSTIVTIIISFNLFNRNKTTIKSKPKSYYQYINHCWSCFEIIDSNKHKRCPKCGWYICSKCSSCGCNYPN